MEDLLTALKAIFVKLYGPFLTTFVASLHAVNPTEVPASWDFASVFAGWDQVFDKVLREFEDKVRTVIFPFPLPSHSLCRTASLDCVPQPELSPSKPPSALRQRTPAPSLHTKLRSRRTAKLSHGMCKRSRTAYAAKARVGVVTEEALADAKAHPVLSAHN